MLKPLASRISVFAALATLALPVAAHDYHGAHDHAILGVGTFDHAPPQSEYYGHFLRGRVHHGPAHHGDGHLNSEAAIHAQGLLLFQSGDRFVVLVEPNLVNRASARRIADRVSVAHCSARHNPVRVTYDRVERHAREQLSAWAFRGHCR